jgi:hypothetical protein
VANGTTALQGQWALARSLRTLISIDRFDRGQWRCSVLRALRARTGSIEIDRWRLLIHLKRIYIF